MIYRCIKPNKIRVYIYITIGDYLFLIIALSNKGNIIKRFSFVCTVDHP